MIVASIKGAFCGFILAARLRARRLRQRGHRHLVCWVVCATSLREGVAESGPGDVVLTSCAGRSAMSPFWAVSGRSARNSGFPWCSRSMVVLLIGYLLSAVRRFPDGTT